MRVSLPIFFNTDETETFEELGLDSDYNQAEIRQMIFYKIDAISDYLSTDSGLTTIYCNGDEYLCKMPKEEVDKLIHD